MEIVGKKAASGFYEEGVGVLAEGFTYAKVSDGEFAITNSEEQTVSYGRDAEKNLVFWKVTE